MKACHVNHIETVVPNLFEIMDHDVNANENIRPGVLHENGRAPFPETILVSAERSGCNLVRHCVEMMAGQRTPGRVHLIGSGPLLFHRTHRALWNEAPMLARAPVMDAIGQPLYHKLILLLRDPVETFVRAFDSVMEDMSRYCDNIAVFHDFPGPKLLIAYDDLVATDAAMAQIFDFLGIGTSFSPAGMTAARESSVEWYNKNQPTGSQTGGRPDRLRFHQSSLTQAEKAAVWDFIGTRLGSEHMPYLARWKSVDHAVAE